MCRAQWALDLRTGSLHPLAPAVPHLHPRLRTSPLISGPITAKSSGSAARCH
jgi:hypothetical protein